MTDDNLRERVERLEAIVAGNEITETKSTMSRRGFVELAGTAAGAALLGTLGTGTAAAQSGDIAGAYRPLAGPESERPDPNGSYVSQWDKYRLLYVSTDTGRMDELSTGEDTWSRVGVFDGSGGPWTDNDSDNLLEIPNYDGVDLAEQRVTDQTRYITGSGEEYRIEAQAERLTVTASETGEIVGALNEHGVLLPTSPVFTSDTTVRSRTEIYQCDTTGSGGSLTLTIGTELENDEQIFAVKDVGGAAGLNQIEVVAESGSDIDGQSSATINSNFGRLSAYYSAAEGQWFSLFTSL
jgi:hypothetical protein